MNVMHYQGYLKQKVKRRLVSYHFTMQDGKQGYGDAELYIPGALKPKEIRNHIIELNGFKSVVLLNISEL